MFVPRLKFYSVGMHERSWIINLVKLGQASHGYVEAVEARFAPPSIEPIVKCLPSRSRRMLIESSRRSFVPYETEFVRDDDPRVRTADGRAGGWLGYDTPQDLHDSLRIPRRSRLLGRPIDYRNGASRRRNNSRTRRGVARSIELPLLRLLFIRLWPLDGRFLCREENPSRAVSRHRYIDRGNRFRRIHLPD